MGVIADLADGWSREWFAGEEMRAAGTFTRVDVRGELRNTTWHTHEAGLAIGISVPGVAGLGAQVLGVAMSAERPADAELLEAVGIECLEDLKYRAAAALHLPEKRWGVADGQRGGPVHRIEIVGPARDPMLTLELSADLFATLVKSKLRAPPPLPALGKPNGALAALPVELSALLGRSAITVAELSGLTQGDVLVLDRALDAALSLAIGGRPVARGACTVSNDGTALKITQAPIG
jgi:flagellar motor switch protein FliN/FliY